MAETSQLGQWGENIACETLTGKGYAIVGRNMRIARIEVDILAMKGNPRLPWWRSRPAATRRGSHIRHRPP